jgi:hypothetical protein
MTPEEFKKIYTDTHLEFQLTDALNAGSFNKGSLIKTSPGDKNITVRGKIPGKALIESREMDKRAEGLSHMVLDACGARASDLMEIPADKLFALAAKLLPQKTESKIDANFTLVNMIQQSQKAKVETIDAE